MIKLEVITYQGRPPAVPMTADFDEFGGTLGRSPDCSLVLADERRGVSRVHGKIDFRNGQYKITDQGTNAMKVNGVPLGKGNATAINAGDRIVIGPYELEVKETADASGPFAVPEVDSSSLAPVTPAPSPVADSANPFGDLLGGSSAAAPDLPSTSGGGILDDLDLGQPQAADPLADESPAHGGALPDDFDPMAPPPTSEPLPPAGANLPDDAFSDFTSTPRAPGAGSLDAMFGLSSEASPDPLANSPLGKPPPSHAGGTDSGLTQWIGGFQKPDDAPVGDATPEIGSAYQPPRALPSEPDRKPDLPEFDDLAPPETAPAPAAAVPSEPSIDDLLGGDASPAGDPFAGLGDEPEEPQAVPAATSTTSPAPLPETVAAPPPVPSGTPGAPASALAAALMDGLGVPELQIQELTPELMYKLGMLLHEATSGTVALLSARGSVKREMRADVTMIASGRNNPLKFSPDGAMALRYMLGSAMPGFMDADEAMRDAYSDLRAHEFGFMAGLRAALADVLKRFDPERLEKRIPEKGGMGGLLSSGRKARLWDHFGELYREISQEAEEDFHALFGREFLRAYEEHIQALERAKARKPG